MSINIKEIITMIFFILLFFVIFGRVFSNNIMLIMDKEANRNYFPYGAGIPFFFTTLPKSTVQYEYYNPQIEFIKDYKRASNQ